MARDVIFDQDVNARINKNIEIFAYEYPEIDEKTWKEFKEKPNCKCRGKVLKKLQKDKSKFNAIMSKLMDEEVEIHFPMPIENPIVKEFETLKEMEDFLNELKSKGKLMRSANPSPNGKGGFVLIVM